MTTADLNAQDPFAPGMPDGPPLHSALSTHLEQLPPTYGEPVLNPFGEREPVVYVLDAYGRSVPMLKSQLPTPQPTPSRDLTPQPLIDHKAQRLAAGGMLAAGAGWGVGEALNAAAGLGTGSLIAIAALATIWKVGPAMGRKTTNNITNTTTVNATNTSRWFGKSTTSTSTTTTHR